MKKVHVFVDEHDGIDKSFTFSLGDIFSAQVDYDDVNHQEVDAATKHLKELIEKHWDHDTFMKYYKEEIMKRWNENKYDIQDDYNGDIKSYLEDHGF